MKLAVLWYIADLQVQKTRGELRSEVKLEQSHIYDPEKWQIFRTMYMLLEKFS